ncbi:30S ribosomal protein S17 [Candidatus Hodgkinia cicadicola]
MRVGAPMTKTVLVVRRVKHLRYKKLIRRSKKFLVHDATHKHRLGEFVLIKACAPYSKRKRWEIIER